MQYHYSSMAGDVDTFGTRRILLAHFPGFGEVHRDCLQSIICREAGATERGSLSASIINCQACCGRSSTKSPMQPDLGLFKTVQYIEAPR